MFGWMITGEFKTGVLRRHGRWPRSAAWRMPLSGLALLALLAFAPGAVLAQNGGAGVQDPDRIAEAQSILRTLGYEPGPADGVLGARTVTAIRTFQRRHGLPETGAPDSAFLAALADRIRISTAAGSSSAAPATSRVQSAQASARTIAFASGGWQILNDDGSTLDLVFRPDGRVEGAGDPSFWQWRSENGIVFIEFDNEMGGWVKRTGRVISPKRMIGNAESSLKQNWSWTAEQTSTP